MERHLILVIDEKTQAILAARVVASTVVDNLITGLDVYVGRVRTEVELKRGLTQFGFQLVSQTEAFRISGL
jgi:hypothetical protein